MPLRAMRRPKLGDRRGRTRPRMEAKSYRQSSSRGGIHCSMSRCAPLPILAAARRRKTTSFPYRRTNSARHPSGPLASARRPSADAPPRATAAKRCLRHPTISDMRPCGTSSSSWGSVSYRSSSSFTSCSTLPGTVTFRFLSTTCRPRLLRHTTSCDIAATRKKRGRPRSV